MILERERKGGRKGGMEVGGEKERERTNNIDVREKHQLVAFCTHPNSIKPAT